MARAFLFVLALLSAVLGYLMDNVWLLYAAGALFLLALIVLLTLAAKRRRRRAAQEQRAAAVATSREEELRALGITEIRPRSAARAPEPEPVQPEPVEDEPAWEDEPTWEDEEVSGGAAATPEDGPLPERTPEPARAPAAEPSEPRPPLAFGAREESPFWQDQSPTAVKSLLRALWAATEVQTVALFHRQRTEYDLLLTLSHVPFTVPEGRSPAAGHFLGAVSPDRPVTVLEGSDPLVRKLPYYRKAPHVGAVAVLPVPGLPQPVFLVADLPPDQPAFSERQRALLLRFAEMLGAMLAQPSEEPSARAVPTRRAIIQEEMNRARAEGRPLALALAYRTDAEDLAEQGPDAVASAERELRLLLEDVTQDGRVERFGEMMAGAFLHADADAIEDWAERVHARADAANAPLAVGIARLGDRHADADALRADAANALQEAVLGQEPVVIG